MRLIDNLFWHTAFQHYVDHRLDDTEAVDPASHLHSARRFKLHACGFIPATCRLP